MGWLRNRETNGYAVFREKDSSIQPGNESVDMGYKLEGYSEFGAPQKSFPGDLAGAQFWRSGREQGIPPEVSRPLGSWAFGGVPCVVTNRGIVPIKNKNLEEDLNYSGKNIEAKPEDVNPNFSAPVDDVVSIDGVKPSEGDIGLVFQCLNQDEEQLLFFPFQKKNDIDPLPIPTLCHGRSDFIESTLPEGLRVVTSLEVDPEEIFVLTNLFRTKNLLVTHKDDTTLLSPVEIGTGTILCRGGQTLVGKQAQNCEGPLSDTFIYVPQLIPGLIKDNFGGETQVWVIHSDGSDELKFSSDCCDDDEEQEPGEVIFPDFLRYQDSFGVEQFLAKDDFVGDLPIYRSASNFANPQIFIDAGLEIFKHPRVDIFPDGGIYKMSIFYGSLDFDEPKQPQAVKDFMQELIDRGVSDFGELSISMKKGSNDLEPLGGYTRANAGNPFQDEREPLGFTVSITPLSI